MSDVAIGPIWKRLGCWGTAGKTRRCKWGEFTPEFGFAFEFIHFPDNTWLTLHLALIWGVFFFKMPWRVGYDSKAPSMLDGRNWGFTLSRDGWSSIHLHWKRKTKILDLPWAWKHVRHEVLTKDGTMQKAAYTWDREEDNRYYETHPFLYLPRNKKEEKQQRQATINVEEREWRWRWLTWLPWPRNISRYICISFNKEVGEEVGSWKGGTVGCCFDLLPGETPLQALRRMEKRWNEVGHGRGYPS